MVSVPVVLWPMWMSPTIVSGGEIVPVALVTSVLAGSTVMSALVMGAASRAASRGAVLILFKFLIMIFSLDFWCCVLD